MLLHVVLFCLVLFGAGSWLLFLVWFGLDSVVLLLSGFCFGQHTIAEQPVLKPNKTNHSNIARSEAEQAFNRKATDQSKPQTKHNTTHDNFGQQHFEQKLRIQVTYI